jgi:hypothetical protein
VERRSDCLDAWLKARTAEADSGWERLTMFLLRFWRAYKRARAVGFPIFEALLAARSHAS